MPTEYYSIRVTRATYEKLQGLQRYLLTKADRFTTNRTWAVTQGDVVAVALEALEEREGLSRREDDPADD